MQWPHPQASRLILMFALIAAQKFPNAQAAPGVVPATPESAFSVPLPANTARLQFSPEIADYSAAITTALNKLVEAGGGTLTIPYGKYPLLKAVQLDTGGKEVSLAIRGEKNAASERPLLFDTDVTSEPHYSFFFQGDANAPGLSVVLSGLEIRGNNVPVDLSRANTKFEIDEGRTDLEPNKNLQPSQTYGHPFFFRAFFSGGILGRNIKSFYADDLVIRDVFGNGIQIANYGNVSWERKNRVLSVTIRNSKILNVWQWHESDNTGDGVMLWNVATGVVENNQIVNDLAYTRWIGRCGIVLEHNTENCLIRNNTVSGYSRNIHIENTFGGHRIAGNRLLASDVAVLLNEPDGRPPAALASSRPVIIENNIVDYNQERERYGIHVFGGERNFISISAARAAALNGSQLLNNRFTYHVNKGVKINPWRENDVRHKTRHIYVGTTAGIKGWVEKGNRYR